MNIQQATAFIASKEGFVPYIYDDGDGRWPRLRWAFGTPIRGTLTIGYGETDPEIIRQYVGREMSQPEAEVVFSRRVLEFWNAIHPHMWREPGTNQATAMLSLAYNIGQAGFVGSSVLRHYNAADLPAAAEAFLLWHRGNFAFELLSRREEERIIFLTPDSAQAGTIPHKELPEMFTCWTPDGVIGFLAMSTKLIVLKAKEMGACTAAGIPDLGPMSDDFLRQLGAADDVLVRA